MEPLETTRHKATEAEMEQRVTQVLHFLVEGISRGQIIEYAAKTWNIGRGATDGVIKRANAVLRNQSVFDRQAEIEKAKRRFELIFQKALHPVKSVRIIQDKVVGPDGRLHNQERVVEIPGKPDYFAALDAEKARCKLLGLNAPDRHEVSSSVVADSEQVTLFIEEAITEGINHDALMAVTLEKLGIDVPAMFPAEHKDQKDETQVSPEHPAET